MEQSIFHSPVNEWRIAYVRAKEEHCEH